MPCRFNGETAGTADEVAASGAGEAARVCSTTVELAPVSSAVCSSDGESSAEVGELVACICKSASVMSSSSRCDGEAAGEGEGESSGSAGSAGSGDAPIPALAEAPVASSFCCCSIAESISS